ncbi:Aminoglycoside phosphotransferase [Pyrenophora tritici-repentis]|nr:Aminoglycoside phosphotransferase [Pyrenophora tritici-repentis]
MRDGFQLVGRIPYPMTEPRHLVIASEVATLDFLRINNIPVPEVYGYSTISQNLAGTEYIFMELVRGVNLGDIWVDLSKKARKTVVTKLVQLESQLFTLQFPGNGSLYYAKDLDADVQRMNIPVADNASLEGFCVGPDTRLHLWYGKRLSLQVGRGPYADSTAVLAAGAEKEIAYLMKFGKPIHPLQLLNLHKYLQIVPRLTPGGNGDLARPTLRHPDLNPNNVFVSDSLDVTWLIDWQHCTILPLFLQCGIPNSLQNYGDSVSESLVPPELPPNISELSEREQYEQVELLRRRQLHYFYAAGTEEYNPLHYQALSDDFSVIRRKIFDHASSPWEGNSVSLKADLVQLVKQWDSFTASNSSTNDEIRQPCPISFSEEEMAECLRLKTAQIEADEQLKAARDAIGVGSEGWVPLKQYDEIKEQNRILKKNAFAAAESEEERIMMDENWVFNDFDEDDYL